VKQFFGGPTAEVEQQPGSKLKLMQPAGALIPLPLVTSWNPLGLSRPVTGLLYLHLYIRRRWNSRLVKN